MHLQLERKMTFLRLSLVFMLSLTFFPTCVYSAVRVTKKQRSGHSAVSVTQPTLNQPPTNITACLLIERGNPHLLYDYDQAAAGIDLAVQYVNENLFPRDIRLQTHYTDIGNSCSFSSDILSYALELWERRVDCAVYIGPGCGMAVERLYSFADFMHIPIIGCPAAGKTTMIWLWSIREYSWLPTRLWKAHQACAKTMNVESQASTLDTKIVLEQFFFHFRPRYSGQNDVCSSTVNWWFSHTDNFLSKNAFRKLPKPQKTPPPPLNLLWNSNERQ